MNDLLILGTFTFFPLAFMHFPQIPLSFKNVDFLGIFPTFGPYIFKMWNAREKKFHALIQFDLLTSRARGYVDGLFS